MDSPTDSSDWSFAPLRELDSTLRCPICFEFYKTAMMLPNCSHNYCSLCIRRYLTQKLQCPMCSASCMDSQLRKNMIVDELVETFTKNRSAFLALLSVASKRAVDKPLKNGIKESTTAAPSLAGSTTPQRKTSNRHSTSTKKNLCHSTSTFSLPSSSPSSSFPRVPSPPPVLEIKDDDSSDDSDYLLASETEFEDEEKGDSDDFIGSSKKKSCRRKKQSASRKKQAHVVSQCARTTAGTTFKSTSSPSDGVTRLLPSKNAAAHPSKVETSLSHILLSTCTLGSKLKASSSPTRLKDQSTSSSSSASSSTPEHAKSAAAMCGSGVHNSTVSGSSLLDLSSPSAGLVECPVCGLLMPEKTINLHLDACLKRIRTTNTPAVTTSSATSSTAVSNTSTTASDSKREKPTTSSLPRLPKLVFHIMKDSELRRRLVQYHLPTCGDRAAKIARLKEFTLQYNAQCDSSNPKSVKEIASEVDRLEKAKMNNSVVNVSSSVGKKKAVSEKEIEQKCRSYEESHKQQYSELIEKAKGKLKSKSSPTNKKTPKHEPNSSQHVETPNTSSVANRTRAEVHSFRSMETPPKYTSSSAPVGEISPGTSSPGTSSIAKLEPRDKQRRSRRALQKRRQLCYTDIEILASDSDTSDGDFIPDRPAKRPKTKNN